MVTEIVSLDDYRKLEEIVKREMKCKHVVFLGVTDDETFTSYVPHEIDDLNLVYMIQMLKDRRIERLS